MCLYFQKITHFLPHKKSNMITVVCPTYNEASSIDKVLQFVSNAKPDVKEIIFVDGGSTDGTPAIIEKWCKELPNIKLLHNPHKYVPFALNLALKNSVGDPIIRLDAHTEYADNYFEQILNTFGRTGADIVGGPMLKKGETVFQRAAAYATSTIFAIGNSKIHNSRFEGETDHVYLGAWKRSLFSEIGYFDERLVRNQDDEFHYRARSKGKKIFLSPSIISYYYPRKNIIRLIKQYFQYGKYKPIVLAKINSEIKVRHIIPSLFILYLIILPFVLSFPALLLPLFLYLIVVIYYSFFNGLKLVEKLICLMIYPSLHLAYGIGFIAGIQLIFKKNEK